MLKPWTTQDNSIFMLIVESIRYQQESNPTERDQIIPDNGLSATATKFWLSLQRAGGLLPALEQLPMFPGASQSGDQRQSRGTGSSISLWFLWGANIHWSKRQGNKKRFLEGHALGLGCMYLGSHWVLERELPLFIIHSKPSDSLPWWQYDCLIHRMFFLFLAQGLIPYYVLYLVVIFLSLLQCRIGPLSFSSFITLTFFKSTDQLFCRRSLILGLSAVS